MIKNSYITGNLIIIFIVSLLVFNSCKTKNIQKKNDTEHEIYLKAKIIKGNLDGCTWLIELQEGKKILEPINLTHEFKTDNLAVWLQYNNHDGNSICMMGQMITIIAIEKR